MFEKPLATLYAVTPNIDTLKELSMLEVRAGRLEKGLTKPIYGVVNVENFPNVYTLSYKGVKREKLDRKREKTQTIKSSPQTTRVKSSQVEKKFERS